MPLTCTNAPTIAVVDYCKGNLRSAQRGLIDAGFNAVITADADEIARADGILLPGVGAFADASRTMLASGQMQAIRESVARGVPFLGICLGLQLVLDAGNEGCAEGESAEGLGFFRGAATRMAATDAAGRAYKIPHVGWNSVHQLAACPLLQGIKQDEFFYFTHSYCGAFEDASAVVATSVHAAEFPAVIARENVFATQFHPEKSSAAGLAVLANFGRIVKGA